MVSYNRVMAYKRVMVGRAVFSHASLFSVFKIGKTASFILSAY